MKIAIVSSIKHVHYVICNNLNHECRLVSTIFDMTVRVYIPNDKYIYILKWYAYPWSNLFYAVLRGVAGSLINCVPHIEGYMLVGSDMIRGH